MNEHEQQDGGSVLCSIEAEQAVIGGLMLAGVSDFSRAAGIVNAGDFFTRENRLLFAALTELSDQQEPFDPITVCDLLDARDGLGDAGGREYVVDLAVNTASAANLEAYAKIVKRFSKRRLFVRVLSEARAAVLNDAENGLARVDKLLMGLDEARDITGLVTLDDILKRGLEKITERSEGAIQPGLLLGFKHIDFRVGGYQPGDLVVVAGRPGMGKTAFIMNALRQVAKQKGPQQSLLYELEMQEQAIAQRMMSSEGHINYGLLKSGKMDSEAWDKLSRACSSLSGLEVKASTDPTMTVSEITAQCLAEHRRQPVNMVIVDYLGLIDGGGDSRQSTADRIAGITRGFKKLAQLLGCPVFLLAQLNRGVEERKNKRPVMSDLRDSGAIEQDADVIHMLYRDDYYKAEGAAHDGMVETITVKLRDGEPGTDYLQFIPQHGLLRDTDQTLLASGYDEHQL